jgi:hypothetical protein
VVSLSRSLVARIAVAVVASASALAAQARLPQPGPTAASAANVPDPSALRLAALDFDALVADAFWLRAVQVVGHEKADMRRDAALIGRLAQVVAALDPWVDHPYRFAAIWLSDEPSTLHHANRLLERGIAYHPLDWRNRFYLSFNHFYSLGDNAEAARVLEPAIHLEGAPRYLGRLLARLRSELGGLETAAAYLEELLRETDDPWKRAEFEKALDEIETERRARHLDAARDVYRTRYGRDIERVEDLVQGPGAVLSALPAELHGWAWQLEPTTGAIVSSYYGRRYQMNFHDGRARTQQRADGEGGR